MAGSREKANGAGWMPAPLELRRAPLMIHPMPHITDPKTGRKLVSATTAARLYGCSTTHLARLGRHEELRRWVESPRRIYYDLEDVKRLAKEKARIRKERGGRPRRRDEAA